jgi:hypothetical protein
MKNKKILSKKSDYIISKSDSSNLYNYLQKEKMVYQEILVDVRHNQNTTLQIYKLYTDA